MYKSNSENKGAVYWITGLAGSGKTTIAQMYFNKLRELGESVIYLDGDILREIIGNSSGYSREQRLIIANRYGRICKMFSDQGLIVVASFIAMFHEVQNWNRENISNYIEVFVDVPLEVLIERDKKELYSGALAGKVFDIVGVDIKAESPVQPELIINNYGENTPQKSVDKIFSYHMDSFHHV